MDGDQSSEKIKPLDDLATRIKYYRRHAVEYFLLVLALVFSIFILTQLSSIIWKIFVISAISLVYLLFGIWHHKEEANLTNKHTLEYLVISTIIFFVLYSIFL